MVTTSSPALTPFTEAQEGVVLKAYRDSGGVWTIGIGFTMLSGVFAAYWLHTRDHKLRVGDTISRAECDMLLTKLLAEEYAPSTNRAFPDTILQHQFDAATDMAYNCGAGTFKDRWAIALKSSNVQQAAILLLTTRITAGGRPLAELRNRRRAEANLLSTGNYGIAPRSKAPDIIAAENRAVDAKVATAGTTVATTAGGTGGTLTSGQFDIWTTGKWAIIALVAAIALSLIWRYRGVILGRRTPA